MISILRMYSQLPPVKGGMEKHIYNLSKYQIEKDFGVVNFYNNGDKVNLESVKICPIFKLNTLGITSIELIVFYLCSVFKVMFSKQQFDIIHIHGDWSSLLFVRILKKLTKAKIVVLSLHDQLTSKYTHQKLLPKFVQDVDLIFSTGYDTANELEKLSGKKVIVQPSGINEIFFEEFDKVFNNDIFTIVTVANLFPKKNIELILDIAKELKDFRFIIVGDGTHRNILEVKIQQENISNVDLLGFKTPNEVKKYYQNSDVYLLTSFAEGTPTSALEAMACGLPIVSSNAGGLGNIVKENINGFIIDTFNKNKFIEKIKSFHNNEEKIKKMFFLNKKSAKQYKWKNVANNITTITQKVFNEKD